MKRGGLPSQATRSLFATWLGKPNPQKPSRTLAADSFALNLVPAPRATPDEAALSQPQTSRGDLNPPLCLDPLPSLLSPRVHSKDSLGEHDLALSGAIDFSVANGEGSSAAGDRTSDGSGSLSPVESESSWAPSNDSNANSDSSLAKKQHCPEAVPKPPVSKHKAKNPAMTSVQAQQQPAVDDTSEPTLSKPPCHTMQLMCGEPQALTRNAAKLVLVELPSQFDVHGDMGVIGRVCGEGCGNKHPKANSGHHGLTSPLSKPCNPATGTTTHTVLDLKGKLFSLTALPLAGTALVINANAKGDTATIQSIFGAVHASVDVGIGLDDDSADKAAFEFDDDDNLHQTFNRGGDAREAALDLRKGYKARKQAAGGGVEAGRHKSGDKSGRGGSRCRAGSGSKRKRTVEIQPGDGDQQGAQAVLNARYSGVKAKSGGSRKRGKGK